MANFVTRLAALCLYSSLALAWDGALPEGILLQTSAPSGSGSSRYHTTEQIWSQIETLKSNCADGNVMQMNEVSAGGRNHKVVTVTGPGDASGRKKLLVTFNIHGRELISGETGLYLSKVLCTSGLVNKVAPSEALANTVITYVPILNPAGRRRADNPDDASANPPHTCTNQRKNGNLVDLNRNFEYAWQSSSGGPGSETFPGSQSMSEPEAKLLEKLATETSFDAYLDVHSGEDAMGWVFGSDKLKAPTHESKMQEITSKINDVVFASSSIGRRWTGRLAAMGGSQAYSSYGCTADYMHQVKNIPISFTWEVWNENNSARRRAAKESAQQLLVQTETPHGMGLAKTASAPSALVPALVEVAEVPQQKKETQEKGEAILVTGMQVQASTSAQLLTLGDMSSVDCFNYFNPSSDGEYDSTVKDYTDAILQLMKDLPRV